MYRLNAGTQPMETTPKPLGSIYDSGGGLIGHFNATSVWGQYGGKFGSYHAGVVTDHWSGRIGEVCRGTLIHSEDGEVVHFRDGNFFFPGGAYAGRYTGDEIGAAAAFLLYLHRRKIWDKKSVLNQ
jgi:hypothetical protein